MSSLTPSCSPTPVSHNIEELSKQLKIARKRQEAECVAQLQHQEEKEQKECEEAAWKEVEAKVQHDREEAEKHTCEEKGKEKVRGTSVGCSVLLTSLYRRLSC